MKRRHSLTGFILVLPFMLGFMIFYIIPFLISVWYTFTSGIGGMSFVGLDNYIEVVNSYAFRLAAGNTFKFIGIGVPIIMSVSLFIALLIYHCVGNTSFFRAAFLYPMVVPIGSTVMFFQIFLAEKGVLNSICESFGLPIKDWLTSGSAFSVLLVLYVWKNCGYNIILFLTGLNTIPADYKEEANLEGCSAIRYFWYIESPLLIPSYVFVFVMSVINAFKCYREAYLLSGKYPDKSIYMLQHFMNNNFETLNYQRLSVAAILIFAVIFLVVIAMFGLKAKSERQV